MLVDARVVPNGIVVGKLKENKKYIYNKETNEMKYVNVPELNFYLNGGWLLGKKYIKRNRIKNVQ